MKLDNLDHAIDHLRKRKEELQVTVSLYNTYLAPVSRLPDDVLLLIFAILRDDSQDSGCRDEPWKAAATCIRWRTLALSCSTLWDDIKLDMNSNAFITKGRVLVECRRAEAQLDRTGLQTPLSCGLHISRNKNVLRGVSTDYLPTLESTFRRLVDNLHRCSRIKVTGSAHSSWELFPERSPTYVSLHTLEVCNNFWLLSGFFRDTPVLRNLTLSYVRLTRSLPPRWQTVRFMELKECATTANKLITILRATQQLQTLILHPTVRSDANDHDYTNIPPNTALAHLPCLRTLKLHFRLPVWMTGYDKLALHIALRHIRAPRLANISLRYPLQDDVSVVRGFITESDISSSIEDLSFEEPSVADTVKSLSDFLPQLSSLKSLVVISKESRLNATSLLTTLQWHDKSADAPSGSQEATRSTKTCPALERLSLRYLTVDPNGLRSMVESRLSQEKDRSATTTSLDLPAQLRFVTLSKLKFEGGSSKGDHLQWFKELEESKKVNQS